MGAVVKARPPAVAKWTEFQPLRKSKSN